MEAFIDQLAVPLMLGFGALALVAALGGILGFLLAANKNRKAVYWWRISGGVSYLSLSTAGAVAVGYLSEGRLTTEICVVAFLLLGVWLLQSGLRLRRRALGEDQTT